MAKTIEFDYAEKHYTLEFDRKSIEAMERQGFVASDIATKPMTLIPTLFAGAFLKNHRFTKKPEIDEIYSHIGNKQDLLAKLVEMYNEPVEALINDEEGVEGNIQWGASW